MEKAYLPFNFFALLDLYFEQSEVVLRPFCWLLEGDSGSYSATPPLMLQHELIGEPVELLRIALLPDPLAGEEDGLHVLLLQHLICYPHQHFYVARARVGIDIRSASAEAGTVGLLIDCRKCSKIIHSPILNGHQPTFIHLLLHYIQENKLILNDHYPSQLPNHMFLSFQLIPCCISHNNK